MRELKYFELWFNKNPEGLRENVTPFGSDKVISRPIAITKENIISHKETVTKYLTKLEEGILPKYYTEKITEYIKEYDRLKQI
tara:strand:+ start:105 stop:353 length:249 start_codon:yes stop_codon:yes gene_type:complete